MLAAHPGRSQGRPRTTPGSQPIGYQRPAHHALPEDAPRPGSANAPGDTGRLRRTSSSPDNGSAYRAAGFARSIASRSEHARVRTRIKSPETNGVVERFFGAIKVEQLWRELPDDGPAMAAAVAEYRALYNHGRPHEALGQRFPLTAYTAPLAPSDAPLPTRQTVPIP